MLKTNNMHPFLYDYNYLAIVRFAITENSLRVKYDFTERNLCISIPVASKRTNILPLGGTKKHHFLANKRTSCLQSVHFFET